MAETQTKTENLSCKISTEHKQLIEQAAKMSGFSMSDFITHTLVSVAFEMLQEEHTIRLTKDEWERFTAALERPAREPGEASKAAMKMFNKGHYEGDKYVW